MSEKGFVPLSSLRGGAPSVSQILDEIRTIYFKTTRETIHNDLAHAVELLKALPDEESREKATVYMHGLAEMRKEWAALRPRSKVKGQRSKVRSKVEGQR